METGTLVRARPGPHFDTASESIIRTISSRPLRPMANFIVSPELFEQERLTSQLNRSSSSPPRPEAPGDDPRQCSLNRTTTESGAEGVGV
jgi:hypothetical protein